MCENASPVFFGQTSSSIRRMHPANKKKKERENTHVDRCCWLYKSNLSTFPFLFLKLQELLYPKTNRTKDLISLCRIGNTYIAAFPAMQEANWDQKVYFFIPINKMFRDFPLSYYFYSRGIVFFKRFANFEWKFPQW